MAACLLGEVGERLVQSHHFYAVFQTPEEYSLVHQGKELGTIPIVTTLVPEMTLVFSGRRWRVIEVQDREKRAVVVPAGAGLPPLFGGQGGAIDDEVVREMRRLYEGEEMPAFLDGTARTLLSEARRTYQDLGLGRVRMIAWEAHTLIFPWAGTAAAYTLVLALKKARLAAWLRGLFIEVDHAPINKVRATLEPLAGTPPLDPMLLADQVAKLERNKFDCFLPSALLALDYIAERLSPTAVALLASEIVEAGTYRPLAARSQSFWRRIVAFQTCTPLRPRRQSGAGLSRVSDDQSSETPESVTTWLVFSEARVTRAKIMPIIKAITGSVISADRPGRYTSTRLVTRSRPAIEPVARAQRIPVLTNSQRRLP
jgi:hypothetical protein